MNILALQGSPREHGNTQAVLDSVLSGAAEAGAEAETVYLAGLEGLVGCKECFSCQRKPDLPGCAVDDGMLAVLDKALAADLIIWATPVFCWSPAWPLKMAMDRFYCMFKFGGDGTIKSLLKGRKMAAVITGGGGDNDGADLVQEICQRMAKFGQAEWLGAMVASQVKSPDDIRNDATIMSRAQAFGHGLVS